MAQRRVRTETAARHDFVRVCSFIALVISALFILVGGILSHWFPHISAILNLIASLAILVAIAFPSWEFARVRSTGWRVTFWVALVIYILGAVLGVGFVYWF